MAKFIFNKFILSYLVLLIPFLNFLNSNVNEINLVIYNQLLIYLLFSIIFQLFVSSVIKFIFLKKINFQEILLVFSIGFYLLFLYRPIKKFFFDILNFNGYAILSLLTIILLTPGHIEPFLTYFVSDSSLYTICIPLPPNTYEGLTNTGYFILSVY